MSAPSHKTILFSESGKRPRVLLAVFLFFLLAGPLPSSMLGTDHSAAPAKAPPPTATGPVEWLGEIHSAQDVTGKGSWFKRLVKAVVGLDDRQKYLLMPHGLDVDREGRLLVADTKARVVHLFDSAHRRYARLEAPESDPFAAPIAVATDAEGRIYVSDSVRSRIFVFGPNGKFQRTLGGLGKEESIFKRATGLAVDSERGRIYVVDTVAMQVVALSFDGKVLSRFGRPGIGPGEFNYPTHIAVDRDGTLWITDSLNFRVQHLDGNGKFLAAFGRLGSGVGAFDKAKGIALDSHGQVYVVEARNDRVHVFDSAGRLRFAFGGTGSAPGEFFLPAGITIDRENRIYVADSYNHRVQIFRRRPEAVSPTQSKMSAPAQRESSPRAGGGN